jgi:chemotaxis protein histidine kinase CheA
MAAEATAAIALRSAPRALSRGLRCLRRRVRALLAARLAAVCIMVIAGAAVPLVVLFKLRGAWCPPLLPELALGAALVLCALAALCWPLPDRLLAASADRRLGLRDRLGSGLQLARAAAPTGMEQAMVYDALDHAARLRAREAYPFRATRPMKASAVLLCLLAAAQLTPLPPLLLTRTEKEDRAFLREQAAKIEPVAKDLEKRAAEAGSTEADELAKQLQKLSQEMRRGRLTKKQALLKMGEMSEKMERTADKLRPQPPKTAARAAQQLQEAAQRTAAQQAAEMAKQAAKQGNKEREKQLRQLAKQMEQAKSTKELKQLAEQLKKQSPKLGATAEMMSQLADALSAEDWDAISKALEGLDKLPEGASPEELKAMAKALEEMSKALSASDLAALAKALSEASECMGSGNCKGASLTLAEALKALKGKLGNCKLAGALRGQCQGGSGLGRGGIARQDRIPANAPGAGLYAPRETQTSPSLAHVRGQINPEGNMLATTEQGAPEKLTQSRVPYYEVIGEYSKSAEEALSKEEVPPGYRDSVRNYFQSLQGGSKK